MWKSHLWQSTEIGGGGNALVSNSFGNTGYPSGERRQNRFLSHTVDKNQFQGNSRPKSETQNLKPSKGNIAENLYDLRKKSS